MQISSRLHQTNFLPLLSTEHFLYMGGLNSGEGLEESNNEGNAHPALSITF